jgi:hypothetical protein
MKKSWLLICSLINLAGAILYLYFTFDGVQFARAEQRRYYDAGDSIDFLARVAPVLLVCSLVNILWLYRAAVDIYRRHDFRSSFAFCLMVAVWGMTLLASQLMIDHGL